jgi:hypothetical protein
MGVGNLTNLQRVSESNTAAESILRLAVGFMASKHLSVASEIRLFAHLASAPNTLDQLAGRIEVPRRTLRC